MININLIPVLVCITLSVGYILLGAFHMMSPGKVLPIYRTLLGKRLFERHALRFEQFRPDNWKMIGVAYIVFGLMLAWSIESAV